jgi:hypothetical protein
MKLGELEYATKKKEKGMVGGEKENPKQGTTECNENRNQALVGMRLDCHSCSYS